MIMPPKIEGENILFGRFIDMPFYTLTIELSDKPDVGSVIFSDLPVSIYSVSTVNKKTVVMDSKGEFLIVEIKDLSEQYGTSLIPMTDENQIIMDEFFKFDQNSWQLKGSVLPLLARLTHFNISKYRD